MANAVLHYPSNTIPRSAIGCLGTLGLPDMVFLESYCYATLVRSACKTLIAYWPSLLVLWRSRVKDLIPASSLAAVLRGDYSNVLANWDNPAFVESLKNAYDSDVGQAAAAHLQQAEEVIAVQKFTEGRLRPQLLASFSWEQLLARRLHRVFSSSGWLITNAYFFQVVFTSC